MTNEERQAKYKQQHEEHYQKMADDVYLFYQSFIKAGFNEEEAFALVSQYMRQTVLDNVIRDEISRQREIDRLSRRTQELMAKLNNKEN